MICNFVLGILLFALFWCMEVNGSPYHQNDAQNNISRNISSFSSRLEAASTLQIRFPSGNNTFPSGGSTIMEGAWSKQGFRRRNKRFIGYANEFGYQVYLSIGSSSCGGAIISRTMILTAAYCVKGVNPSNITVTAGAIDLSGDSIWKQTRSVDEIHLYPNYTLAEEGNDIAILVLSQPLDYSPGVYNIRLPQRNAVFAGVATVSGWGATESVNSTGNHLKYAEIPIVPNSECSEQYANINVTITENMMCVGGEGKDACQGDGGGPAICEADRRGWNFALCGIISFGEGCGLADYPGVYTRVSKYNSWILGVWADHLIARHCKQHDGLNLPTPRPASGSEDTIEVGDISLVVPLQTLCQITADESPGALIDFEWRESESEMVLVLRCNGCRVASNGQGNIGLSESP